MSRFIKSKVRSIRDGRALVGVGAMGAAKNGSGPSETKQEQDMIAKPRQSIVNWHQLTNMVW